MTGRELSLRRTIEVIAIPSGEGARLHEGTLVTVAQALGGTATVRTDRGLFRVGPADLDAVGLESAVPEAGAAAGAEVFSEGAVWEALRGCYDPEIPVNIVDLGLVYDLVAEGDGAGGHRVDVKMTLTAPGCGMGKVIAEDARRRIGALPGVTTAAVHIVWDPQWDPTMISEAGRKALGME